MFKKITVALALLTVTFAFSLSVRGADQGSSTNGATSGKAQAQTAGCDKCDLKGAGKEQANTGKAAKQCKDCKCSSKGKPCNKNCKDCPSAADCKTRKNCDKDCVKQAKGATEAGKKSGCNKKTKDGKPCPADCDKRADSAKK